MSGKDTVRGLRRLADPNPSAMIAAEIAKAVGWTTDYLLTGEEEPAAESEQTPVNTTINSAADLRKRVEEFGAEIGATQVSVTFAIP